MLCFLLTYLSYLPTLQRFASTKDTTGRVLQGGVANRWEVRLKQVDTFLQESYEETPVMKMLLEKAKVSIPYMKEVRTTTMRERT